KSRAAAKASSVAISTRFWRNTCDGVAASRRHVSFTRMSGCSTTVTPAWVCALADTQTLFADAHRKVERRKGANVQYPVFSFQFSIGTPNRHGVMAKSTQPCSTDHWTLKTGYWSIPEFCATLPAMQQAKIFATATLIAFSFFHAPAQEPEA